MVADPEDRIPADDEVVARKCEALGDWAEQHHYHLATAESLTAGNLAASLGRASGSGAWFRGGVIAYHPAVKHHLLDVPDGPVVSEPSARAMAASTARLLEADIAIAVTGEAGPDPQEDVPPGTVWFGVYDRGDVRAEHRRFDGEPDEVLAATVSTGLDLLLALITRRPTPERTSHDD